MVAEGAPCMLETFNHVPLLCAIDLHGYHIIPTRQTYVHVRM